MRIKLTACLAVLAGLLMVSSAQAERHGRIYAMVSAQTGYDLQPLLHDQLAPMDANRAAIVTLAQKHLPNDTMALALTDYIGKQRRACFTNLAGGLIPVGLAAAERSPLHLCTHAFLAGTQALLQRLNDKAPTAEVQALYAKVFAEGGLVGCVYSATTFDTNRIEYPPVLNPHDMLELYGIAAIFGLIILAPGLPRARRRRLA